MSHIARTIGPAVLLVVALAAPAALLVGAGTAHAEQTPEQRCQQGRYYAAAKYAQCQQKAMAKLVGGGDPILHREVIGKCQMKYAAVWPKLQRKASGSHVTCDQPRLKDNGTTVTDNLTGLQWEKKTDDASVHDKDNAESWSNALILDASDEDGTVFTSFLAALNSGGCFAGQCGWRLPTVAELQTILLAPYPCSTSPCIDAVFGPAVSYGYWSSNTYPDAPNYAWFVGFYDGYVNATYKTSYGSVRAVRGGL